MWLNKMNFNFRNMRNYILILFVISIVLIFSFSNFAIAEHIDNDIIIYFYSTTCSSCQRVKDLIETKETNNINISIKKYNISDLNNKSLLNEYNELYKVKEEDKGIVPVIFLHDKYFTGENNTKKYLNDEINRSNAPKTAIIKDNNPDFSNEKKIFSGFKIIGVFTTGLINGLNPCSMSMLLFFLSLLIIKNVNVIKVGFAFISGKIIMYFLLGTILFSMLSKYEIGWLPYITKITIIIFTIILICLCIKDYISARNESYGKIILQLPVKLRKFNHSLIKRTSNISKQWLIILISFILGLIISCGEFLCTGQIYLATILTILHTDRGLYLQAILYLFVYVIAFVIPLIIIIIFVNKGREIFNISEILRERLHIIKLINAAVFIIFCFITLFMF